MDRKEQGRRENQNPELDKEALSEAPSPTTKLNLLFKEIERFVTTHPHSGEMLIEDLTDIALEYGCFAPECPPPSVDGFGRVGLPPANVPLAPYKPEFLDRKPISVNIRQMFDNLYPESDTDSEPEG